MLRKQGFHSLRRQKLLQNIYFSLLTSAPPKYLPETLTRDLLEHIDIPLKNTQLVNIYSVLFVRLFSKVLFFCFF